MHLQVPPLVQWQPKHRRDFASRHRGNEHGTFRVRNRYGGRRCLRPPRRSVEGQVVERSPHVLPR